MSSVSLKGMILKNQFNAGKIINLRVNITHTKSVPWIVGTSYPWLSRQL